MIIQTKGLFTKYLVRKIKKLLDKSERDLFVKQVPKTGA